MKKGNSSLCGEDDSVFMMMIVIIFLVYLQGRENVKPKKPHDHHIDMIKRDPEMPTHYAKPVK